MDSFEFNKIAGAVLGTALGVMAIGIIAEVIYAPGVPAKPGFEIAVAEGGGEEAGGAPVGGEAKPIAVRLASADVKSGEASAKACLACHTVKKGEPKKVGPNLFGIVGGPAAHMEGFPYSNAMHQRREKGVNWTFEELDKFLENPKGYVPGTAMGFGGVKKPDQRANVIAYLNTLSDSPQPLPQAAEAGSQPAGGEKPAEGAAPAKPAEGAAPAQPQPPASQAPAAGKEAAPAGTPETPPAGEKPAATK